MQCKNLIDNIHYIISTTMKKFLIALFLFCLIAPLSAQRMDVIDFVKANPQRSFGTDFPYTFDVPALTPAPKGYKAFYLSHYSRHGSRYYWTNELYPKLLDIMTEAEEKGVITEEGKAFKQKLSAIMPELMAGYGELTQKGWEQHQGIARTMYQSFPEIFKQGGKISAVSSLSGRCVISMAAFCTAMTQCNPKLDIRQQSSRATLDAVVPNDGQNPNLVKYKEEMPRFAPDQMGKLGGPIDYNKFLSKYFTDPSKLSVKPHALYEDLKNLYTSLPSIGHEGLMGTLFTDQDIADNWERSNFGTYMWLYPLRMAQVPILKNIVECAKAVIDGKSNDIASLRFGHDGNLGPLTLLMGINGTDKKITDVSEIKYYYQNWNTCKASNIQLVFYKNAKTADVLVKCLLNGEEATLPLPADNAPYYKWSDFEKYYTDLCASAKLAEAPKKPQLKEDFVSLSSNQYGNEYPMANSDGYVRNRVFAPNAQKVEFQINGIKFPMTKDKEGYWTGDSTQPFDEGNHYYGILIDGVEVPDPNSTFIYGSGAERTQIEMPAHDQWKYELRNVEHGNLREVYYHSSVTGKERRMFVYTPPTYDANVKKRFPVLYLQHGFTENETGWSHQGRCGWIMDNLLAEGKALPFIIVMDNGEVSHNVDMAERSKIFDVAFTVFPKILLEDIIPFVESHYRVIADADHRALAGLSMGGMQTRVIGLANPKTFKNIGIFSGGMISTEDLAQNPDYAKYNKLTFITYGSREVNRDKNAQPQAGPMRNVDPEGTVAAIREAGVNAYYYESPNTAHEWQTWRRSLYEFAQKLFK